VFALSPGELGIVSFILVLIVGAGKLPRWGEAVGSLLYRRRAGKTAASRDTAERAERPSRQ